MSLIRFIRVVKFALLLSGYLLLLAQTNGWTALAVLLMVMGATIVIDTK